MPDLNNVKATYNAQTDIEDKISVYLSYNAYYNRIEEINAYVNVNVDEYESKERRVEMEKAGLPIRTSTAEEDALREELRKQVLKDIIGDGSRDAIIKGLKAFALVKTKNAYDLGLIYKKHYDDIAAGKPKPDAKIIERNAIYLAYMDQDMANAKHRGVDEIGRDTSDLLRLESTDNDLNFYFADKMFANLDYEKNMPMSYFMEKIGFQEYEKKQYLLDMGCKASDKVYDVFKKRLMDSGNDEKDITDNDIRYAISEEYSKELSKSVFLESSGSQIERLQMYYSKNMTVDYYLSLLYMDDAAKNEYYNTHDCTADTKLYDLIKSELRVDELLKLRGIDNKAEIDKFLEDNHCTLYGRIPKDMELSEKDVKNAASAYMTSVLDTEEKMNKNIQFMTILEFSKQFTSKTDKDAYYNGRRVAGYAGLPELPEKNYVTEDKIREDFLEKGLSKEEADKKTAKAVEYQKWAYSDGKKRLDTAYLDELKNVYTDSVSEAFGRNPLKFREKPEVLDFFDSNMQMSSVTFLRGVIRELEATGTGKRYKNSTKDRSGNSKEYNDMLKTLKKYYGKTAAGDRDGIDAVKNALREKCLSYISDKKKVRRRQFGRTRFDMVMTLLSDIMPKSEFETVVDSVNTERKVHENDDGFVTVGDYNKKYADIFEAYEEIEEKRQIKAEKDYVTDMPDEYKKRFQHVLNVYGRQPDSGRYLGDDSLYTAFGDEFDNYFEVVNDSFVPIGKGLKERNLSEEDFAAIAYAGSLTDEAGALDKNVEVSMTHLPYKALMTGPKYTIALAAEEISPEVSDYHESIEGGRKAAVQAMVGYANGDKTKLAHVLGSGIRHIAAMCRGREEVDDTFYCNGEMGRRMVDMLDRDPELMQLVIHNEDYMLIMEDIAYIGAVNNAAEIYTKAMEAEKAMSYQDADFNEEGKTELLTDIMLLHVLNESRKKYHNAVKADDKYNKNLKSALDTHIAKTDAAISKEITEDFTKEDRDLMIDRAYNDYEVDKLIAADKYHNDRLMTSINNKKSVDALRKSVRTLVKESGMNKQTPASALASMNDNRIIQKLATLTGKADDKAAGEWNVRVTNAKKDREKSIAEKKARNALRIAKKSARKPHA